MSDVSRVNLASALAIAQGQFKTPTLNRTAKIKNAQGQLLYETNYADLQECISCIKEPLSSNGLAFTQTIDFIHTPKEMWVLKLTLRHSSNELIDSILPLNVTQNPQQLGGALTYFKRYQLSAFFGLAADFDDDGNAAVGKGNVIDGAEKKKFEAKKTVTPPVENQTIPSPGNYVMPFGEGTKGKPLRDIPIETLTTVLNYIDGELEKDTVGADTKKNLSLVKTAIKKFIAAPRLPPFDKKLVENALDGLANETVSNEVKKKEPDPFSAVDPKYQAKDKPKTNKPKEGASVNSTGGVGSATPNALDDYVIPFDLGDLEVKGKKLKELPEKVLRNVIIQLGHEMSKGPEEITAKFGTLSLKNLFDIRSVISTFLVSMGVKV